MTFIKLLTPNAFFTVENVKRDGSCTLRSKVTIILISSTKGPGVQIKLIVSQGVFARSENLIPCLTKYKSNQL